MARDWESWFGTAIGPASATEEQDRDRTVERIRRAIAADRRLSPNVRVFVKGSYADFTNVRRDSDVDVAVEWKSWSYISKRGDAQNLDWSELGVALAGAAQRPGTDEYRRWVEEALVSAFGARLVDTGGSKHIYVAGSSTTLDADVVPCFRHELYLGRRSRPSQGIVIYPKGGGIRIENWPQQNLDNGIAKNKGTRRRYKQMVRAIKRLENDMVDTKRLSKPVHGYFIECLLYNVRDSIFGGGSVFTTPYKQTALDVLATMYHTINDGQSEDWVEVNERKWLWRGGQTWTRQEAMTFASSAWNYVKKN